MKKKNVFLTSIKILFSVILILLIAVAGLLVYSAVDKYSPLNYISSDYSLIAHTDSIINAVNPLLDLKALDTILSDKMFSKYRSSIMTLRSNKLRNSKIVKLLGARKGDVVFFAEGQNQNDFICVVNLSYLSIVARTLPLWINKIKIEGLSFIESHVNQNLTKTLCYGTGTSAIYIKPVKNLLLVGSLDMINNACAKNHYNEYDEYNKSILLKRNTTDWRITADAKRLTSSMISQSGIVTKINPLLENNQKSNINFNISDDEIKVSLSLPFNKEEIVGSPFNTIMQNPSSVPALISYLGENVQYFTLLNAGSLEELKNAAFPLLENSSNVNETWKKAEGICKSIFGMNLEEILFSWTGKEFALFGLENNKDPVLAIRIENETKRKEVFEKVFSSYLIENNTSLIINGIRLPRLELPSFLRNILNVFKINLSLPYFLVKDNYIYFSQSPQNLSVIFNQSQNKDFLVKTPNYNIISSDHKSLSTASIFYNLKQNKPFFIQNNTLFAKILNLYNLGYLNFELENFTLLCKLHAAAIENTSLSLIPGFPVSLNNKPDYEIYSDNLKIPQNVFWKEGSNVKTLNLSSLQTSSVLIPELYAVIPNIQKQNDEYYIYAVTKTGTIYLLNEKLENKPDFPIRTSFMPSAKPAMYLNSLVFTSSDGQIVEVSNTGKTSHYKLASDAQFKARPYVHENIISFYDKGFDGHIYIMKDNISIPSFSDVTYEGISLKNDLSKIDSPAFAPINTQGIAFGSPASVENLGQIRTAFLTQAGEFFLYEGNTLLPDFPVNLENIFFANAYYFDGYYYALSYDAQIYRISSDGSYYSVQLPDCYSSRNDWFTVIENGKNEGIYVCADSNIIYGFNRNLEILNGFPVAGCGICTFADANGDGNEDCITVSVDKKIYAWNLK